MSYQNEPKPYASGTPAPPYTSPVQSPQPQYQQQYQQYPDQSYQQQYQYQTPQIIQSPPPVHQPIPQAQMEHKGHPSGPAQNTRPGEWQHGMCDCFGDCGKCCLTCWCPCITYGRIQHRLRYPDMSNYSSCNGHCWGFCGLMVCCGFQWIMSMMQRGEVRHRYNLDGSGCGDCMRHFCCECCALIQEDRETETRKTLLVPANQAGYQQQQGMTYPGHQ
ncbi:hypothetical protein ABW19_dt0200648 [Dactylella cylindrospora]|nr:hypothetical protein ABW19_dt0200648 [Dactylella cylindrospora]